MNDPIPSLTIASLNEIETILQFMKKFYSIDRYDFQYERTKKALFEFIPHDHLGRIWLISIDQVVIGYIVLAYDFCFEFGGRNAFVDEFYLEKEYRGKGIGKKVIEYVTEEAKKLKITALHLEVEQHNEKALNLYRAFQFKDHHRILMTRMINE